jgi:signal transduction histidine kinase
MNARTARRFAWGSWLAAGALSLAGILIAVVGVRLTSTPIALALLTLAFVAVFGTVGALVASRKPDNSIGWLFLAVTFLFSLGAPFDGIAARARATGESTSSLARVSDWSGTWTWIPAVVIPITLLFLLFPSGRPLSPRWRLGVWAAVIGTILFAVSSAFAPARYTPGSAAFLTHNPYGVHFFGTTLGQTIGLIGLVGILVGIVGGVASLVIRSRRSTGEERQQLRLFTATSAISITIILTASVVGAALPENVAVSNALIAATLIAITLIPISVGVAILRYRLYDIDVVINRTVVFGALAAFITLAYVGIVVGIGSAIGEGSSIGLSIAATALVALAFHPVQLGVQRFANRLVYGERATPYQVMTEFVHRLGGTLSVDDALPRLAETAALGIGATASRVRLILPNREVRTVRWPDGSDEIVPTREVPVLHRGEEIGQIAVTKPAGQPITPAEGRLLEDLASQAGIALRNVRLRLELERRLAEIAERSDQLKVSRQRLVTARDAQRRQLERDIREGAQGQLLDIGSKLGAAAACVGEDPDTAIALLDGLGEEANVALEGLRDLARGIFPPLLAEEGVRAALEAHLRKNGVRATLDVSPELSGARFDSDTEAAIYFCCVQAIQNVARHAGHATSVVHLARSDGSIEFSVTDDGVGFDLSSTPRGMGLQIMLDRVEALGGTLEVESAPGRGTRVTGRVPVRTEAAVR